MKKLFRIFVLLIVVVAVAAALYAWASADKKGGKTKLVIAEAGSITEKALAVGQIEPRLKFSIKSKISGVVRKCLVQVGDSVRVGDPLFEIAPDPTPTDVTDASSAVQTTRSAFEQAKVDFSRQQSLYKQGIAPKSSLDSAQTAFDLARIGKG